MAMSSADLAVGLPTVRRQPGVDLLALHQVEPDDLAGRRCASITATMPAWVSP